MIQKLQIKKMKMFNKRGFTLIELLVVIAIIGILASIVLVSFPTASKKANDSRIISAISQARIVMITVYSNDGNYAGFDKLLPLVDMKSLNDEIVAKAVGGTWSVVKSTDNLAACMYAQLNAKATYYYCADSSGKAGFTTTVPSTTCVSTGTATCPTDTTG